MRFLLAATLLGVGTAASAQTRTSGDLTVTGAMGAGTSMPRAALEVSMQAADSYALKVSSVDGTSLLLLDRSAKAGLGVTPTGARLDMNGRADAGEVALELRAGNSTSSVTSAQAAFGTAEGAYRHNIRTAHTGAQNSGNAIDFYLWTSSDAVYALGSSKVMSIQASSGTSMGGLQVDPSTTTLGAELVVSSGTVYAGGVILAGGVVSPTCFASLKTDIVHLGEEDRARAVRDVLALKPVSFIYKGDPGGQRRVGLVLEDSPESVRSKAGAVVLDERLMNLELALQAARTRIDALKGEISRLEGRRR
ncbi:hypothetical protein EPO15_14970 [bacterium]|nr:MAG: hypothetical protein EPO15_14970 [bacterium]